ncbi:MAG: hypothetical protein FWF84_02180 [Kiritimatiellaeota bacterium]|nr:hypothetical protein [Kiritimatiellota bacterium]
MKTVLVKACVAAVAACVAQGVARGAAEFALEEHYGVNHPVQVVTFDVPEGFAVEGVVAAAEERRSAEGKVSQSLVPVQFVDGGRKVAVLTALAAGERVRWTVGEEVACDDAIAGQKTCATGETCATALRALATDEWEVDNGLIAIRVPRFSEGHEVGVEVAPLVDVFGDAEGSPRATALAPVQGVRLADGTWTGLWPNLLSAYATEVRKVSTEVVEQGVLRVVLKVRYEFTRPELLGGREGDLVASAMTGYYETTITLDAGQRSAVFEEDTDMDVAWGVNLYEGLFPTQARYRGHHASKAEYGRWANGERYDTGWNGEATVDVQYERAQLPNYFPGPDTFRYMAVWDPWVYDSGWYWMAYDSDQWSVVSGQQDAGNLVGIFAGRAGRAIGAAHNGTGIFTMPEDPRNPGKRCFGIAVRMRRNMPDGRFLPRTRYQWGLFSSTVAEAGLPEERSHAVNSQMNVHGGINLDKISRWTLDFEEPRGGYGAAFMSRSGIDALRRRVKEDEEYYRWLYNNDTYTRALFDAWREDGRVKYDECVEAVLRDGREMMADLVEREGIYAANSHYWHGGIVAMRAGVWIDQLLYDSRCTPEQATKLRATAVMFASVLWDEDHTPIGVRDHALNLGTENMPTQQWGIRRFFALFMAKHPTMTERAERIVSVVSNQVESVISEYGAASGSPHYMGAAIVPTCNSLLQIRRLGEIDPFAAWPKLALFGEFFLNIQTPPDPRRDGKRSILTIGDGGTETSIIFGQMGTGLARSNPELSAALMGAWAEGGKQHSFFYGTTTVMIDDALPAKQRPLGDATFPGYYSVLRNGWDTPEETAVFFVNGDFYRDHRHDDHGSVVVHALGQPISTDWAGFYTPHAPGSYVHSMVVPEKNLAHPWDKDGALIAGNPSGWRKPTQTAFSSETDTATSEAAFTGNDMTWTRRVTVNRSLPETPVIVVRDTFDGDGANIPKIVTFNFVATNSVATPWGEVTPPMHYHPQEARTETETEKLPSAMPANTLDDRIARWDFTGQYDVDFAVFSVGTPGRQALLGAWGNLASGAGPEHQHILRVKDTGAVTTVIVPWRRGDAAPDLRLREENDTLIISINGTDL